jgi:hypothetical protein
VFDENRSLLERPGRSHGAGHERAGDAGPQAFDVGAAHHDFLAHVVSQPDARRILLCIGQDSGLAPRDEAIDHQSCGGHPDDTLSRHVPDDDVGDHAVPVAVHADLERAVRFVVREFQHGR